MKKKHRVLSAGKQKPKTEVIINYQLKFLGALES